MPPITRLDHVVIAVKNLDAAAASYRKLGFTLTPRGLHEGKGTGNHCIMFGSTYIELLGIVDETGAKGRLAQRVNDRGEGGMAIAYGADDADKTHAALRAAGIEAETPNDLSRPLNLDGQREMVRFRNIMLPGLQLPETMQFVCTHQTPELTRARHEWQLHPSGATGVAEVIVAVDDIAAAQSQLVPAALANAQITLTTPAEIERRFGKSMQGAPKHGIVAMTVRVNEPDAAAAMLSMAKIPHHETRNTVTVPAHAAHGVVIEFAET
ncbi:MAG: VOC family protein [Alphaproteobacteria bacterium]|nr:VOC family protein [Alphaproteobacteria bacterium]